MDDVTTMLDVAAQNQDWLALALLVLVVAVPLALKATGKKVPFVDTVVAGVLSFLRGRKPKAPPPVPEGEKDGLGAIVDIKEEKK